MYLLHRVFCSLPAELQEERSAFFNAVGDFNQEQGIQNGILFVPVAASSALRAVAPGDVRANIRECRHYIEVLPAGAADPTNNPQLCYDFAVRCCADADLPMREVVVLRSEQFGNLTEFRSRIHEFLSRWLAALVAQTAIA